MGSSRFPIFKNVRGIRDTIPSGYVLGRSSDGHGHVELIPLRNLGSAVAATGTVASPGQVSQQVAAGTGFFFLGVQAKGLFASRDRIILPVTPHAVTFPSATAAAGRSVAHAETAPTAAVDLILTDDYINYWTNGTNVLCTVHFGAASNTGTLTYGTTTVISQGTVLYLVFPTSADATLANINLLFCGDK